MYRQHLEVLALEVLGKWERRCRALLPTVEREEENLRQKRQGSSQFLLCGPVLHQPAYPHQ